MRTTAIPSMLDVLARNYKNRNEKAKLYEIATNYQPLEDGELPKEYKRAVIGLYGNSYNYYTIKGIVEELCYCLKVDNYDVEPVKDNPTFHPGRTAKFTIDGKTLAVVGEIHPSVCENYGINTRVYIAEVDMNTAFENAAETRIHKTLPKFPATTRDLALVCDREVPVLSIKKEIENAVGKILENVTLFDVYEGNQIDEGKKSVAFNIKMRAADRTLTDEEADGAVKRVLKALNKIGINLRS